jgi:hypothetical protein
MMENDEQRTIEQQQSEKKKKTKTKECAFHITESSEEEPDTEDSLPNSQILTQKKVTQTDQDE